MRVDRPWKYLQPALHQCNAEQFPRTAKAFIKHANSVSVSDFKAWMESER